MFPRDCAELIKALGSFDYACANKHLLRISKSHPTVGSICSKVIQCEGVYTSLQFLKPKMFRREDHLYQMYNEISVEVEREILVYRDAAMSVLGGSPDIMSVDSPVQPPTLSFTSPKNVGSRQQSGGRGTGAGSGRNSPVMNMSEGGQPSIHQFITGSNNSTHAHGAGDSSSNSYSSSNHNSRVVSEHIPNLGLSLSPTYNSLQFHRHQGASSFHGGRGEQSAADHVVLYTILRELCSLRMALINIYRTLSLSTVEIEVSTLLAETDHTLQLFDSNTLEIQMSVLGQGIACEIRALKHTLLMDRAVSEYDIQNSATNLHLALVSLSDWKRMSSEQDYADKSVHRPEETSWRLTFFGVGSSSSNNQLSSSSGTGGAGGAGGGGGASASGGGGSGGGGGGGDEKSKPSTSSAGAGGSSNKNKFNLQPNHIQWLERWVASEKSKMTIYFMDLLLEKEQAMGGDERSVWANTDPDMHGMIRTFRKKAGAHSVSFVFEISRDIRFSTQGFVSANAPYEPPTGLNSFPCIYSYPPDPPRDHWPNIISIMQGSVNILRQFRSQYFYDRKIGCTYYVARVDEHVSIVIIYLDKHPQPDTGAMDFLQLLAGKLRHSEVLSALRVE